jgi:hypothetical protein
MRFTAQHNDKGNCKNDLLSKLDCGCGESGISSMSNLAKDEKVRKQATVRPQEGK